MRARGRGGRQRAPATGSDSGNLLARIPGPEGARTILLCAHLDTVPLAAPVEVVREGGVFRNANEAILGADNKAAVAVLLAVARRLAARRAARGRRAAVHHRRGAGAARRQGGRPPRAAQRVRLRLRPRQPDRRADRGRAHLLPARGPLPRRRGPRRASGPRTGRNAIAAAARAIAVDAARPARRARPPPTSGTIEGGTAANVVAERCEVELEARSLDDETAGRADRRDGRRLLRGRQRRGVRRGDHGRAALPRATGCRARAPPVRGRGRGARVAGHRARLRAHRRRQRRQRADRRRPAGAQRGQRHRAQPPARRARDRRGAGAGCST